MNEIIVATVEKQPALVRPASAGAEQLFPIVESEEIAWTLARISPGATVRHQPDPLLRVIYQIQGSARVRVIGDAEFTDLAAGHFVVLPEFSTCEITSLEQTTFVEQVIFFGLEQLPGAFFNTYRSSNG